MSKKLTLIGDIHGKYMPYLKILEQNPENTVQIGDFGFGFGTLGRHQFIDGLIGASVAEHGGTHRMIRGNHDDPDEALKSKHFIKDGTVEGNVMYIGGAASIDRAMRVEGKSWWAKEESSDEELAVLVNLYEKVKPDILITHECHESWAANKMIPYVNGISNFRSRTRDALEAMHAIRKPEVHIFGHWHVRIDEYDGPTRMVCIPELGTLEIEVDE